MLNEELRDNCILNLIERYLEKHELAKEFGARYMYRNDIAQIDAIKLIADILDLYAV